MRISLMITGVSEHLLQHDNEKLNHVTETNEAGRVRKHRRRKHCSPSVNSVLSRLKICSTHFWREHPLYLFARVTRFLEFSLRVSVGFIQFNPFSLIGFNKLGI